MNIIQQVFNNVNRQYFWIIAGNQEGFENEQLANAKITMDDIFMLLSKNLLIKVHLRMRIRKMTTLETMHYA